jgi:CDP-diacylglycerol--glycerol-3-phosphate 3-phosphatidyltransferase
VPISANQVTLARLVLLPVPVLMVYRGGPDWYLGALVVYTLIGLTDAIDGWLARRYGSTPLGALLDPLADKLFLVAALGPLADQRIVPLVAVVLLFARELGVTALRSISLEEHFDFRTSRVAKLKTAVQMGGTGFILLIRIFRDPEVIATILLAAAALAALPVLHALGRRRRPGWKALWGLMLIAAIAVTRLLLPPSRASLAIMSFILAITLYSGAEYAWGMRRVLADRFRRRPLEVLRLAGLSLAVPFLLLPALGYDGVPAFTVFAVLAAELAAGGVDNSLVQNGSARDGRWDLLRSLAQAGLGAALLAALARGWGPAEVHLLALAALAVTFGDVAQRVLRHPRAFRPVPAAAGARR